MGKAKRNRAARTENAAPEFYWHGGYPGLRPGDFILSPRENATAAAIFQGATDTNPWGYPSDPRRVYITNHLETARAFARMFAMPVAGNTTGFGWVYKVRPVQPVIPDPDFSNAGTAFSTTRALIVAVESRDVSALTERDIIRITASALAWDNGDPIYDGAGRFLPSHQMTAYGFTSEQLTERFGTWSPADEVLGALGRELLERR